MRLLVLIALALTLAGCEETPLGYTFTPPPTPGGRMCANQCRLAHDYCIEACDLKHRTCVANVQARALQDYDKYTREQFNTNQPMDLFLSDFERMHPCDDVRDSCNRDCENGYRICYGSCGGTVSFTGSCQFLCF